MNLWANSKLLAFVLSAGIAALFVFAATDPRPPIGECIGILVEAESAEEAVQMLRRLGDMVDWRGMTDPSFCGEVKLLEIRIAGERVFTLRPSK